MKLMTLNLWGGKLWEPLKKFLYSWQRDIDIFLFQEVHSDSPDCPPFVGDLYERLEKILENHRGFFFRTSENLLMEKEFPGMKRGLAMFVRKGLKAEKISEWKMSENAETGVFQFILVNGVGIMNVHGHHKANKHDSDETILQSEKIISEAGRFGRTIIGGDFNLVPDTKSIRLLEENGWLNLVKEYGIKETRNHLTPWYEKGVRYSDYVFTKGVDIFSFQALKDEVSDHLPLVLEYE